MRRVAVVGASGSGKTWLARRLSERLDCEHIELDAIHHLPGWVPIGPDEMRAIVRSRTDAERWVVDGNYGQLVGDIVMERADTVVWLDLPRRVVVPRVLARSLRRIGRRQRLWNGNRERPLKLLDPRPRENIVLWAWAQRDVLRARYGSLRVDASHAHLAWHRLHSARQVSAWLAALPVTDADGRPAP